MGDVVAFPNRKKPKTYLINATVTFVRIADNKKQACELVRFYMNEALMDVDACQVLYVEAYEAGNDVTE